MKDLISMRGLKIKALFISMICRDMPWLSFVIICVSSVKLLTLEE
jgi:hypothetical protein